MSSKRKWFSVEQIFTVGLFQLQHSDTIFLAIENRSAERLGTKTY